MAASDLPGSTDVWKIVAPGRSGCRTFYGDEWVFNRAWARVYKGGTNTVVGYKLEILNGVLAWKELHRIN